MCPQIDFIVIPKSIMEIPNEAFGTIHQINYLGSKDEWDNINKIQNWAILSESSIINYLDVPNTNANEA
jgi:hypothetical protein